MALHALPKTVPRFTSRQHLTPLRTSVRCLTLAAHQPITLRSTNPPCPPHPCSARVLPTHLHSSPLLRRRQSTQAPTNEGQPQGAVQSFPDPDRPDLFYHLFTPPTALSSTTPVFALSFLASPPPSILSSTILGWLPASGEGDGAGLNDFVENGASPRAAGSHAFLLSCCCARAWAKRCDRTRRGPEAESEIRMRTIY